MPMQIRRTATPDLPPTGLAEGQLGVEMASDPPRVWVGVPTAVDPSGRRLLVPAPAQSGATAPTNPRVGDLWYDTANNVVMLYDGSNWIELPSDDPRDGLLYARRDGEWVVINIPEIPQGVSLFPSGGRLQVGATNQNLTYVPYNGSFIRVNGADYPIPPGGVNAIRSNATINGVAGQTLADNTTYYVYLFVQSGALSMDFSQTGHATDTSPDNVGIEIKSGDPSRSLIGVVRLTTGAFWDSQLSRLVRSWHNRMPSTGQNWGSFAANSNSVWWPSGAIGALNFADDSIFVTGAGNAVNGNAGAGNFFGIMRDGSIVTNAYQQYTGTTTQIVSMAVADNPPEGYHSYQMAVMTSIAQMQCTAGLSLIILGG